MNASLLLLRHGAVENMFPERFRGRADLALSAEGERQAELAAARIARGWAIGGIFTSPLKRCVQTASYLETITGLAARPASELIDIDYGSWTGKVQSEMASEQPEAWALWRDQPCAPASASSQDD